MTMMNANNDFTITCCFTGSRPKNLAGYNKSHYTKLVSELTDYLDKFLDAWDDNPTFTVKFITGGAQGFDQLAFWTVHNLKTKRSNICNTVYVPFRGQERRWRMDGLFGQREYQLMLKLADEVVYLHDTPNQNEVRRLLFERNHRMVDDSQHLFALCNDREWLSKRPYSGTTECMHYAAESEMKKGEEYPHLVITHVLHYTILDGQLRLD
jgi:uncharacterized phage-like protein YoqJ